MDNFPAENMEVDENGMEVSQYCLGLPTVLRKILEQFSKKELVQLSLVNKQWNFEARSVLRDQGSLRAKISLYDNEIQALGVFASDLQQMNVVPYTGITMFLAHKYKCTTSAKESLDPICNAIVGRLHCKHLEVSLRCFLNCHRSCAAFTLGQKIFKGYWYVLQELTLSLNYSLDPVEPFRNIIQDSEFPRLTTLNIKDACTDTDGSIANFIKFLVSCAPNLQEINFADPIKFETNILEGSSAVLVPWSLFRPMIEQVCESLIGALRAKQLIISRDINVELLNRYIPMVLEASCTSLKILELELFFLVPLMCYGICLENVTELTLDFHNDSLRHVPPRVLKVLGKLDFTRVFPKLTAVTIRGSGGVLFSPDRFSGFVERSHAVLRNALPDRAINIQHLELLSFDDSEYNGPVVAQMFPNVKKLTVRTRRSYPYQFALIWEHFANLEELDIQFPWWFWSGQAMAGDFCGIFREEVAELMEKDEEYLKAVNIVPVMPSIRSMKNLRILKLDLLTTDDSWSKDDQSIAFNEFTGWVGFARCPALAVTLKVTSSLGTVRVYPQPKWEGQ